jgi:hypothetical protein
MADHVNILRASTSPRVADHFSFKRSESMSLPLQCTSASRSDYREGSETQNPISQLPSHRQSRRMIKNTSDLNTVLTDSDIEETGICDFCNMSHAEEITVVQAHQTVLKRQGISLPDAIRRCYTFSLSFNNIHHPEKARHSHDEGCICVDGCGPLCPHAQDQVACGPLCHEGSPCGRQFPPCSCSGSCDQSKCSCIKFSRDCDGCSCENCTNSVSHNANSPAVVVKTSTIPEAEDGLFAAQYIAPGQHIGPFTGVFRFDGPDDDGPTRFFTFSKGKKVRHQLPCCADSPSDSCIDSSVGGNYTYKINHAATKSAANVIFKHHYSMGTHVVKVVALRELWPGDEMLAQYCSNKSRKLTFVLASPVYNSNPPAVPDAFKIDKGKGDFNQRQVSTITWSSEYMVVPCGPWEACAPISLYSECFANRGSRSHAKTKSQFKARKLRKETMYQLKVRLLRGK